MKRTSGVAKALMMLTQVSLTMLVPIFLCLFLGLFLNEALGTVYAVPIFLVLGIAAAFRNVYLLTKSFYEKEKKQEDADLEQVEALVREGREKQERNRQKKEKEENSKNRKWKPSEGRKGGESHGE